MENKTEIMQHVLQMQPFCLLLNIKRMSRVLFYVFAYVYIICLKVDVLLYKNHFYLNF